MANIDMLSDMESVTSSDVDEETTITNSRPVDETSASHSGDAGECGIPAAPNSSSGCIEVAQPETSAPANATEKRLQRKLVPRVASNPFNVFQQNYYREKRARGNCQINNREVAEAYQQLSDAERSQLSAPEMTTAETEALPKESSIKQSRKLIKVLYKAANALWTDHGIQTIYMMSSASESETVVIGKEASELVDKAQELGDVLRKRVARRAPSGLRRKKAKLTTTHNAPTIESLRTMLRSELTELYHKATGKRRFPFSKTSLQDGVLVADEHVLKEVPGNLHFPSTGLNCLSMKQLRDWCDFLQTNERHFVRKA